MKRFFNTQKLFLFAIMVVLPICVAYYSINNMLEEQFNATKESIIHELRHQIANIKITSSPEYQINEFLDILINQKHLCRKKPEIIKKFIEDVDKKYPGAFRWFFLDGNYNILPINSKQILLPNKYWQICLKGAIYTYNRLKDGSKKEEDFDKVFTEYMKTIPKMQIASGDEKKFELFFEKKNEAIEGKWENKKCYIIWNTDGLSFNQYGRVKELAGVCALVVFPEQLPENIWLKRLIVRRSKLSKKYKFPIAAINISHNESFVLDQTIPQDKEFIDGLINAYNKRTNELFEYKNYVIGTTPANQDSEIRVLSMANLRKATLDKGYMQLLLIITCSFLLIVSLVFSLYIKNIHIALVSLRQRIAIIFIIAMTLPIISLISLGKTFVANEENRLKESAFVKMRANIETLNMHYKDTPRLAEVKLYEKLKKLIGSQPNSVEQVSGGMEKALQENLISQYVFFKSTDVVASSWESLELGFVKILQYMAREILKKDETEKKPSNSDLVEGLVGDDLKYFQKVLFENTEIDFSRPSHLRYIGAMDQHLYSMSLRIIINKDPYVLFIFVKDNLVEKDFAIHEFTSNNSAAQQVSGSLIIPELSFYSNIEGNDHCPPESPIWTEMEGVLKRSSEFNIEEFGIINILDEEFLYLTKPLSSMNSKTYQPCLLTSTKPIAMRIRDVGILLFSLSGLAILGSILLSFALSSSLLVPIQKIDSAAQKVGKGDLSIELPVEGNDELGRLSITFNEMVKGLRERKRMSAYVSDSVLEAVKDDSDQSIHEGKYVEATILFSDIRNFTGISESNEPEKVFKVLNEFFGGAEPIIRMQRGRVDKYIGDAVMAVFHQTQKEHHALSAIKAAVKMKSFVGLMNQERIEKGLFPIEIGIGISTGHVLLGDVGSRHRKDLTVIGDEVNLASRLESASKQGHYSKIIFSGQTLKFIEEYVEAVKMPFEEIRGKKNAVQIYEFIKFKENMEI